MTDRRVRDEYEFLEELGRGSFSVVWKAKNKKTGDAQAIKVISKKELVDKKTARRLQTEVDILTKVKHPNIIALTDLFDEPDNLYMVMQLVTGGELFDKIMKKGQYSEKDACAVIHKVVAAIHYLHGHNIAHRDLKPENLLVHGDDDTQVMISDFGLSRIIGDNSMMSTACGTPYYVAPEVIKAEQYSKEVDMWSIGVITYFILCGYPPFMGESLQQIFESIQNCEYDFPAVEWDNISSSAKDFIKKLLTTDPRKRMTAEQGLTHPWLLSGGSEGRIKTEKFSSSKQSLKLMKTNSK